MADFDDNASQQDDDSWLSGLTPFERAEAQRDAEASGYAPEPAPVVNEDTFSSLRYNDEDAARELTEKIVNPELEALRSEISEIKRSRAQEIESRRNVTMAEANKRILGVYPKASKILQSREFRDYVNAKGNKYSTDTEFDSLMRAYYAGDSEYVINEIGSFVSNRGKSAVPIGAEPRSGGGRAVVGDARRAGLMSDEEYLRKRQQIKSAPRGAYPPNALRELVNAYMQGRG